MTIDEHQRPDLTPLIKTSESIGKVLKQSDIVINESTVYFDAHNENCVTALALEKFISLRFDDDFFAGYSATRINRGDKQHCGTTIKKVWVQGKARKGLSDIPSFNRFREFQTKNIRPKNREHTHDSL
ncbi:hypothetical protein [Aromatoleum bremense]|nr:hypothetical protein [Aromatoleum bremense]QTQ33519.1 putative UDP-glucose/GDP-mannose dehydrogenase [Aromatoleum bremense]